jgi:sporulation protein YlmC with PRC-barrel domain
MSDDLRLKKLRGSGGYIMANIDDDQQRKGSLGGPDLFLAPIGRIEEKQISKYFCNTCEKDYDGSPDIDYENPNEEVAENLILMEKGQYVCGVCSSILAEYREFKKPDDAIDVGVAKPMEQLDVQQPEAESSSSSIPNFDSQPEAESSSSSIPNFDSQPEANYLSSSTQGDINSIVGMTVFDSNAKKIGTIKQIGIDTSQNLVLVIEKHDGSELTIPWDKVNSVGEIVLLKDQNCNSSPPSNTTPTNSSLCPDCNFENKSNSKFCEQCGTKL